MNGVNFFLKNARKRKKPQELRQSENCKKITRIHLKYKTRTNILGDTAACKLSSELDLISFLLLTILTILALRGTAILMTQSQLILIELKRRRTSETNRNRFKIIYSVLRWFQTSNMIHVYLIKVHVLLKLH